MAALLLLDGLQFGKKCAEMPEGLPVHAFDLLRDFLEKLFPALHVILSFHKLRLIWLEHKGKIKTRRGEQKLSPLAFSISIAFT